MRHRIPRIAASATAALALLAGCAAEGGQDQQAAAEAPAGESAGDGSSEDGSGEGEQPDDQELQDLLGEQGETKDPNEDVEDGVYEGNGVVLPVPADWSLDPTAFQQGVVAAMPENGDQQLTAQAIDAEQAAAAGQELDLDTLLEGVRQQVDQEPEIDEEVEVAGAERAHRLTYRDLPAQQEGGPQSSATIVLAEGEGRVAELAYSATSETYDSDRASLLVEQAGLDPDSDPPKMPQQPAPEGQGEAPQGQGEAPENEGSSPDQG